jgi:hypothetical protein
MYEKIYPEINPEEIKEEKEKFRGMARVKLRLVFKTYATGKERIEIIEKEMSTMYKFLENSEQISADLKMCVGIKNKKEFVEATLRAIEPIIDLRINKPEVFVPERIDNREIIEINELLSYEIESDIVQIHIVPEGKVENAMAKFGDGLQKLAHIISELKDIKTVEASSWIVANHPKLPERYGFTIDGQIDEITREKYFADEKRKVWRAHMDRDEFLKRYL